jgi:hypothetical protein
MKDRWDECKPLVFLVLRFVIIGNAVGAIAYWVFVPKGVYVSRGDLCMWLGVLGWAGIEWFSYRHREAQRRLAQPRQMEVYFDESAGYWTCQVEKLESDEDTTTRICFATRFEEDAIPEPHRESGIQVVGKIHCIVEGEFWVWQETSPSV